MTCRCKLIVLIKRFCCNPLREGRRERGKEFLLLSCCTRIVFILYSRLTRRKGGETELGLHEYGVPMSLQFYSHLRKKRSRDGNIVASVLYSYCDIIAFRLEEEEGRGECPVIVFVVYTSFDEEEGRREGIRIASLFHSHCNSIGFRLETDARMGQRCCIACLSIHIALLLSSY